MINYLLFHSDIKIIINNYINNDKDLIYNLLNMNDNQLNLIFNFNHKYILERIDRFIEIDLNKKLRYLKFNFYRYFINNEITEEDDYLNEISLEIDKINDSNYKLRDEVIKYNITMYLKYRTKKKPKQIYIQC